MQHLVRLYLCVLASVLWPAVSHADEEWSATFVPVATASYLPAGNISILVAPAGAPSPERTAATQALMKALKESGRAELVLDNAAIGEVGTADDPAIVARCANLEMITHVAVLRLLEGTPPKALVTIYAKSGGDVLVGFVATKSKALSATAEPAQDTSAPQAGEGVSQKALDAVNRVRADARVATEEAQEEIEDAQAKYDEQYIGYVDGTSGAAPGTTSDFWIGKYKKPVAGADFYKAVGRDDLAAQYSKRHTSKWMLFISSSTIALLALTIGMESEPRSDGEGAAVVITALGTVTAVVCLVINPHPISMRERRRIADEHNQRLRKELGLNASVNHSRANTSLVEVRVAPALSKDFQGIALQGRF